MLCRGGHAPLVQRGDADGSCSVEDLVGGTGCFGVALVALRGRV